MAQYAIAGDIAPHMKTPMSNPLTYCMGDNMDQSFNHPTGRRFGQFSKPCQAFMSDKCATKWDIYCEIASRNQNNSYPNAINCGQTMHHGQYTITAGDILIYNTAWKKYLVPHQGLKRTCERFDPEDPDTPLICYYSQNQPFIFRVNPKIIDNDVVMNKILEKPFIAADILVNIYNTARRTRQLKELSTTKLGNYFKSSHFQRMIAKPGR
jgi:hypothetical protein